MDGAQLVLDFVFDVLRVHRLEARRTRSRTAAATVRCRSLARIPGRHPASCVLRNGIYLDQALWTILADARRETRSVRRSRLVQLTYTRGWTSANSIFDLPPELTRARNRRPARRRPASSPRPPLRRSKPTPLSTTFRNDFATANLLGRQQHTRLSCTAAGAAECRAEGAVECLLIGRDGQEGRTGGTGKQPGTGRLSCILDRSCVLVRASSLKALSRRPLFTAKLLERRFHGRRVIRLWTDDGGPVDDAIEAIGHVPLPPCTSSVTIASRIATLSDRVSPRARGFGWLPRRGMHYQPGAQRPLSAARGIEESR